MTSFKLQLERNVCCAVLITTSLHNKASSKLAIDVLCYKVELHGGCCAEIGKRE